MTEHYVLVLLLALLALLASLGLLGGLAWRRWLSNGRAMQWLRRNEPDEDVVTLLRRGAFISELHASTPGDAIAELVRALGSLLAGMKRRVRSAVVERELLAATGVGDEVAIPHAVVEGLDRPLLALGRASHGIDFDAPDGRRARFVFLLLIPPKAHDLEIQILASIARATIDESARELLGRANGLEEVTRVLEDSAQKTRQSQRPKRISQEAAKARR